MKWEVWPHHVYAGAGWVLALAALVTAVALDERRLAWCALFATAAVVTYTVTATILVTAQTQREAYEIGREHEQRLRAEQGVPRLSHTPKP